MNHPGTFLPASSSRVPSRTMRGVSCALVLIAAVSVGWWKSRAPGTPARASAGAVVTPAPAAPSRPARTEDPAPISWKEQGRIVRDGVAVEFLLGRAPGGTPDASEPREGRDAAFALRLSYAEGHAPITRANLAGWVVRRTPGTTTDEHSSFRQVESLVSRGLLTRAALDLTAYYALTLNHESIAVIDPRFGFGGSKLLAMVPLRGIGHDWALTPDERLLLVTVPAARRVVVVETRTWAERPGGIATPLPPEQIVAAPGGRYLWVAEGEDPAGRLVSGVAALDPATLTVVARIPTGRGPHRLARDGAERLFVTNGGAGTVSVIDADALRLRAEVATGARPIAVDFSTRARRAYVLHAGGRLAAVDGDRGAVVARPEALAGATRLRFAPGGRLGFLLSPTGRAVAVLDAARDRITRRATFEHEPDRLSFSPQFAYIHHRGGPSLSIVPLADLDRPGTFLTLGELPIGRSEFGAIEAETPADAVAPVPGGNEVLIAHPIDQSIHFFKEGMNAPMGEARNYGGEPRAVLVVDRSLSERSRPGTYETYGRLPEAGSYDLVVFLDAPRIAHSFPFEIAADPELARARAAGRFDLEWIVPARTAPAGRPLTVALGLTDRASGAAWTLREEVVVSVFLSPGTWHRRLTARHRGDGIYSCAFTPPEPGVYYLDLRDPTPCDDLGRAATLILQAVHPDGSEPAATDRP